MKLLRFALHIIIILSLLLSGCNASATPPAQRFELLSDVKILSAKGGRDKVLFEFKDDNYQSIKQYKSLKRFCAKEIAEGKKLQSEVFTEVAEYDFNDDGITDNLLKITSGLYGKSGSRYKLILHSNNALLKEINIGANPSNLAIMKSKAKGLHDIGFSSDLFHSVCKYGGKGSYFLENPAPLMMTNFLADENNWEVKNGKVFLYYFNIRIGGEVPSKDELPFHVGIKINLLSPYLKSTTIWGYDKNGTILSFHSLAEPYHIETFVFVAEVIDEKKVLQILQDRFKDGYVFPDDEVFAY